MVVEIILGAFLLIETTVLVLVLLHQRKNEHRRIQVVRDILDNQPLKKPERDSDLLIKSVRSIRNYFNNLLRKLHENIAESERASTRLSRNIQKSLIFTADISTQAEENMETAKRLRDDVTEGSSAVEEITASIDSLSRQVMEQLRAIETTSEAMSEIDKSLRNVFNIASERLVDTDELVKVTQEGNSKVSETDMVIRVVSEKVQGVSDLIAVINGIASKTNLLAMNAAIEAAHAGDAGRGFAVVAEEIRNLATSTSENAKTISGTLGELVDQIKEAGAYSHASGEAFIEINKGVESLTGSFKEINRLTSEISGRSREVVESAVSLEGISSRTAESMDEMGIGSQEIGKILSSSLSIADDLDSSMERLTDKARGINLISTKISESYLRSNRSFEHLSKTLIEATGISEDSVQNRISISNIILAHINWTATARAVMDGLISVDSVNLVDSRNCQLGLWLESNGTNEIKDKVKLRNLTETHEELHSIVKSLFKSVQSKDRTSATDLYRQLLDVSRKIVQILTTIGYDNFIKWDASLSVGIAEFDKHHQKLISLINKLYVNMESGEGEEVLRNTLKELIDYTNYHFAAENEAFRKFSYPDEEKHIVQHEALLKKARELQSGFQSGQAVLTNEVLDFLQDWVTNHILKTDRQYTQFLKGKV